MKTKQYTHWAIWNKVNGNILDNKLYNTRKEAKETYKDMDELALGCDEGHWEDYSIKKVQVCVLA